MIDQIPQGFENGFGFVIFRCFYCRGLLRRRSKATLKTCRGRHLMTKFINIWHESIGLYPFHPAYQKWTPTSCCTSKLRLQPNLHTSQDLHLQHTMVDKSVEEEVKASGTSYAKAWGGEIPHVRYLIGSNSNHTRRVACSSSGACNIDSGSTCPPATNPTAPVPSSPPFQHISQRL